VVRPYAVTKGRTVAADGTSAGLLDVVVAVVDLASDIDLAVGVGRVLLSDLGEYGIIRIQGAIRGAVTNERLLRDVLDGLHAL